MMKEYVSSLFEFLKEHGDSAIATQQEKYMKDRYPFIGIKKKKLSELFKEFQHIHGSVSKDLFREFADETIKYNEREMWYLGLDKLIQFKKLLVSDDLEFLEEWIIRGDWWDIVDLVATHLIGILALKDERLRDEIDAWIHSENMWKRRTSLIYPMKYDATDYQEDKLYKRILEVAGEKEFFIQKAIGWILREYSKSNPNSVHQFIEKNSNVLSPLSIREASKYI